jgi:uncharacterized protein YxjI
MRYMLKEKIWSFGDSYVICDENQAPVYEIEGKAFSWGDKLFFRDMAGNELAYIEQTLMSLLPTYEIYRKGVPFAKVVKEFSWIKEEFVLDVPGPNDYSVSGSFWQHEFVFQRGGHSVATASKKLWSLTDVYGVEIVDGEDDVAILATALVIELICKDDD